MRVIVAAALAVTLSATSLLAASTGPLAPGKPAGVTKAQDSDAGLWWLAGIGAAGAVIIITQTGNSSSTPVATASQ